MKGLGDSVGSARVYLTPRMISRTSRVIMSDGKKILEKAMRIRKLQPESKVSLKVTAPLCSKTKHFLEEHGIEIL